MRTLDEVRDRIQEVEAMLEKLQEAKSKEINKYYFARQLEVINYLFFQESICNSVLKELKWYIKDEDNN